MQLITSEIEIRRKVSSRIGNGAQRPGCRTGSLQEVPCHRWRAAMAALRTIASVFEPEHAEAPRISVGAPEAVRVRGRFAEAGVVAENVNVLWWYYTIMIRVTFSLDDATVAAIRRTAERLRKPQSQVVREAVADYAARTNRLSDAERVHLLGVLDRLKEQRPSRGVRDVDAELAGLRAARRRGGRRHPLG